MFQCVVDSFACCISHLSVGEVRWGEEDLTKEQIEGEGEGEIRIAA